MKQLIALFSLFAVAFSATAANVTKVSVKALDGFGGDTSSVATRCQTKVGAEYDPIIITRDVNALKSSGEFESISADAQRVAEGVEITFFVTRKIRYAAPLVVEGNDALSESKIANEAELKDGFLYGDADLSAAAARIKLAYEKKHYPDVKVTYRTHVVGGNDATVTFVIEEGVRKKVSSYRFEGAEHAIKLSSWERISLNQKIKDDCFDVLELHEAINDLPWWNPMGWFSDSPVTAEQQALACDKIAEIYRKHGYLDVKVTGPERRPSGDGDKIDVVFNVNEGTRYRIGSVKLTGLTRYPENAVREKSALPQPGDIAGEQTLYDAARRIEIAVGSGDLGLADTRVDIKCIPTSDPKTVNVVFKITEGIPVVIADVRIRGNDYTKDKVIRREIALGPGDRMLADRAERSQKRLENLGYFSRVRYYLEKTDDPIDSAGNESRNLVYEVEEKNTGSFMVGIGASTVDSVYISAEVNQNNFDLFAPSKLFRGAGQKGRLYVAWGPRYQSIEAGFVEPHFLNRMLELSVDAYRRLRWYDQFDIIRSGAMASIAYPVKFWPTWDPFGRLGIGASGEYIEFDDVDWGTYQYGNKVGPLFLEEEREYGDAIEPTLHVFWAKDTRDNFRTPTRGHRTRIFANLTPGGDNEYWRFGFNHRSYFNVWRQLAGYDVDHVLMVALRGETTDTLTGELPIYDRLFLGGPRSIRGIKYRHASPMARRVYGGFWPWQYHGYNNYDLASVYYADDYAPWDGQTLACMNIEYTIPIVKMLRFAVFTDLGSVAADEWDMEFSNTFTWSVGAGIRLDIPMFPIRLDLATPVVKPDEAEKEVFSFTVGYDF
ncbi:MAG: outer membrane protein assembly factor BamA [Kiritimatiellae bacterium]|nr:outer membrane protein assembly factor BamA [Kiritimatiellia bacterium]